MEAEDIELDNNRGTWGNLLEDLMQSSNEPEGVVIVEVVESVVNRLRRGSRSKKVMSLKASRSLRIEAISLRRHHATGFSESTSDSLVPCSLFE